MIAVALACVGLVWYLLIWFLGFLGFHIARTRYRPAQIPSPLETRSPEEVPGVTILRPLRGLDCNLYENLEASFLQRYPRFEIILSVAKQDDPAIPVVQSLFSKYPHVDARLIIGEEIVGVNPKINNLIRSYRLAKHDMLWVVDSNILTSTGTCARSVALLSATPAPGERQIGLVHHLPFAIYPADDLGARVEQVFLCSTHPKMYLAINELAIASCVAGKSCLFRKVDLEAAAEKKRAGGKGLLLAGGEGGLAAFGKYLGEDNMIAEALWLELDMRHAMGTDIAGNTVGSMDYATFFRRRVRWIRVRKYMVVASTLVEPLTECFALGIVESFVLKRLFSLSPLLFLPLHVASWFILDISIFQFLSHASPAPLRTRRPAHDGPGLAYARAWCLREAMAFPIWAFAMLGYTVGWRDDGQTYRVLRDGSVRLARENEGDGWAEGMLRWTRKRLDRREGYARLNPSESEG